MMWELISGKDFFGHLTFMSRVEQKIKKGERDEIPENPVIPEYYKDLLQICWSQNPEDRPSFTQCIEKLKAKNIEAGGITADPAKLSIPTYATLLEELIISEDEKTNYTVKVLDNF